MGSQNTPALDTVSVRKVGVALCKQIITMEKECHGVDTYLRCTLPLTGSLGATAGLVDSYCIRSKLY